MTRRHILYPVKCCECGRLLRTEEDPYRGWQNVPIGGDALGWLCPDCQNAALEKAAREYDLRRVEKGQVTYQSAQRPGGEKVPKIRTENGKVLDTRNLPNGVEPIFCSNCGCRIGWIDTAYCEAPSALYCEDCAADLRLCS